MLRSRRQTCGGTLIAVPIHTRVGTFTAHFSECGLAKFVFPDDERPASCRATAGNFPSELKEWIKLTENAVSAVLAGHQPSLCPPFDLRAGTDFQQRVWAALQNISLGQTKSYADVAAAVGSPRAFRAVGAACGANPIPVLIPCPRVLASGGKLGGFSGGLDWKKRLLAIETAGRWGTKSLPGAESHSPEKFLFPALGSG